METYYLVTLRDRHGARIDFRTRKTEEAARFLADEWTRRPDFEDGVRISVHRYRPPDLLRTQTAPDLPTQQEQLDEAERRGRIRDVPLDRALPVLTSWDFGIADPPVVAYWQLDGSEIRCLGTDPQEAGNALMNQYPNLVYFLEGRVRALHAARLEATAKAERRGANPVDFLLSVEEQLERLTTTEPDSDFPSQLELLEVLASEVRRLSLQIQEERRDRAEELQRLSRQLRALIS